MPWGSLLLCGWPGLARLWFRGHLPSLVIALGFSILLNLALISTFLWPWSLGGTFPLVAWPIILLIWMLSARAAYRNLPKLMQVAKPGENQEEESVDAQSDTLFLQAQDEYLMGHWEETQLLLRRRLDLEPRDVEARLLLATCFRHQRKMEQAERELATIERFDEAINWDYEITRERELIRMIQLDQTDNGSYDGASDDDLSQRFNDGFVLKQAAAPENFELEIQTSRHDSGTASLTSTDGDEILFGDTSHQS